MIERQRMSIQTDKKLLLLAAALLLPACIHIHPSGIALAKDLSEATEEPASFKVADDHDAPERGGVRGIPPMAEIRRLQEEIARLQEQVGRLSAMLAEQDGMRAGPGRAYISRSTNDVPMIGGLFRSDSEIRGHAGPDHGEGHDGHEHGHDHAEWHFEERHFEGDLPMISMEFRDEPRFVQRGEQFRQRQGRDRGMNPRERSGRRPMRGMNPRMRNLTPRWNQGMTPDMPRGHAARQGMGAMRGGAFPRGVVMGRTGAMPGMQPWGPQGGIVVIEPGMWHGEMMFHGADGNFAIFHETGAGHSRSCGSEGCGEEKECPYLKSQCEEDSDCCGSEECGEEKECPFMKERDSECCGDDGCCHGEKESKFHGHGHGGFEVEEKSGTKVIMIRKESGDSGDLRKELLDARVEASESAYENSLGSTQMIVEMISDYLPEDLDLKGDVDIQIHTDIEGADLPPGMEGELKEMLEKMMLEVEVEMKETGKSGKKRTAEKESQNESKKKAVKKKQTVKKKQAAKKKAAQKKSTNNESKAKESKKKQNRKKRTGAVKKAESGSSLEIRVRELSKLGVPVF